MPDLPDFRLETYFAQWEFKARYHLTASDAQTLPMAELLAMADADRPRRWRSGRTGWTRKTARSPGETLTLSHGQRVAK